MKKWQSIDVTQQRSVKSLIGYNSVLKFSRAKNCQSDTACNFSAAVSKFFFGVDELRAHVEVWYAVRLVTIFNNLLLGTDRIHRVGRPVSAKPHSRDMMRTADDLEDTRSMNSGK